jgi:hypothetical protein
MEVLFLIFMLAPGIGTTLTVLYGVDPNYRLTNLKTASVAPQMEPMKSKELIRYMHFLSILLKLTNKETKVLLLVADRSLSIWKLSGVKFLITYLAECLRVIFDLLSENPIKNDKTWVSCYSNGVPKLFGMPGRTYFEELLVSKRTGNPVEVNSLKVCRALISACAMFRSLSPEHVVSFKTVTSPWTGTGSIPTASLEKVVANMALRDIRKGLKSPSLIWSNKSGVNARYAWLSAGLDLLAMMDRPSVYLAYIKYCVHCRYYVWLTYFIMMTISLLPVFLLNLLMKILFDKSADLDLGRLAVIKEMRGKARVVGITDFWTQCLLRPLHDSIYNFLGDYVPEDGTNNQLGPIKLLLSRGKELNHFVTSVDLSAATDRLPVSLQAEILELMGLPGVHWRKLLARPYVYMDEEYVYEVGQPMGAYSSFAMLALTNHVICRVAYLNTGVTYSKGSGQYAILGDDVAIAVVPVAVEYTKLMQMIGVEINPIKGFRGKILEFAKVIFHVDGTNLSPISAKVLLRAVRDPVFIPALLNDYINKGFWNILNTELSTLTKLLESHNKIGMASVKWLFSILGPQSGFWSHFSGNEVGLRPFQLLFEEF